MPMGDGQLSSDPEVLEGLSERLSAGDCVALLLVHPV
jgi:hypothetical protein